MLDARETDDLAALHTRAWAGILIDPVTSLAARRETVLWRLFACRML